MAKFRCQVKLGKRWLDAMVDDEGERWEVTPAGSRQLAQDTCMPPRPPGEYVRAYVTGGVKGTSLCGNRLVHTSFVRVRKGRGWTYPFETDASAAA